MLKIPAEYERDISSTKFTAISHQVSHDSLLGVSVGICNKALGDESVTITTQLETENRSEDWRSAWDALYDTTL
jgi:hypothetical protein